MMVCSSEVEWPLVNADSRFVDRAMGRIGLRLELRSELWFRPHRPLFLTSCTMHKSTVCVLHTRCL